MANTVVVSNSVPSLFDEAPSTGAIVTTMTATEYVWVSANGDTVSLQGTFTYSGGAIDLSGTVSSIEIDLASSGSGTDVSAVYSPPVSNLSDLTDGSITPFWRAVLQPAQDITIEAGGDFVNFSDMRDGFGADGVLAGIPGSFADTMTIQSSGTFSGDALRTSTLDGAADTILVERTDGSDDVFVVGDFLYAAITSARSVQGGNDIITDVSTSGGLTYLIGDVGDASANISIDGGDDTITGGSVSAVIVGDLYQFSDDDQALTLNGGHDVLTGSSDGDVIVGDVFDMDNFSTSTINVLNGGDDLIYGGTGSDIIYGDYTLSDTGDLTGGDDEIYGGGQADAIFGQGGIDVIEGNGGADTIEGGGGADVIEGNNGADDILGGNGTDTIKGGKGDDSISGGQKDDSITGGSGSDILKGGSGDDILKGGRNGDTLTGGSGDDTLTGNEASDVFVFSGAFGQDIITDFGATRSGEVIDLSGVSAITGFTDLQTNHMTSVGANVLIDDNSGNTIILQGVDAADLDAGDFIF